MRISTTESYHSRFCKVLEYIDMHLDGDLTVDQLSCISAFSKYHFHRQFSGLFGISVYKYVQLTRLKRAAYQLAFRDRSVIDVALANGYENPESFARAFKKSFGQSPSEFRNQPQWEPWRLIYQPLSDIRSNFMKPQNQPEHVQLIIFEDTRVAVLEHHGDPNLIGDSVRRFIKWRKQNNLSPQVSATFNILYNNPSEISTKDYRLDICAATEREVAENSFGVVEKTIPGGKCAVLRHIGSDVNLGESIMYLYSKWLPQSGEEPRDFPLYLQRVSFFPDVPEHEAITDVFLPLK